MAFAMKVSPVSSTEGVPGARGSRYQPGTSPKADRISITFPAFVVAMTRRCMMRPSAAESTFKDLFLHRDQLVNAVTAEFEEFAEGGGAKRKFFGGALNLDEFITISHDNVEIHVR